jgi:hypothetical protein
VRAAAQKNVAEWEKEKAEAHEHHAAASAVELAVATAPGARPFLLPPPPGGRYSQYGLHQNPVQAISPSPPLPPSVALPTAAEVKAVIPLVPECSQKDLSDTAKKFLEQAAWKLNRDNPLEALSVMRSAQAAMYAAHKADLGNMLPSAYTANVFTRIPPAEQSSATTAMKQGYDKTMAWRKAEQALGALSDRIRKRYFHSVFNGPSQMARMTEGDMSALDRLALAVVTGKDVSEPTESDTSGATPLIQPPENLLDIADPDATRQLDALPMLDKARVNAYLARARDMLRTNPAGAAQSAMRAAMIAKESGAHDLARHILHHVRALAEGGNMTVTADAASRMQAGGKTVSPVTSRALGTDNPNGPARLSAVGRLELAVAAGKSAGTSAGHSTGAARPRAYPGSAHPPAGHPTPESHHLHEMHVLHLEHLQHLHALHLEHLQHLATHPVAAPKKTPGPVTHATTAGKTVKK